MILVDKGTKIKTTLEFIDNVKTLHEKAGDYESIKIYSAMADCLKECESYRELGTQQGASAAVAANCGIKSIELVDISFKNFRPWAYLFDDVELFLYERSSINFSKIELKNVDFLLIDSLHKPNYLKKELNLHHNSVNKYIAIHDTNQFKNMQYEVELFIKNNKEWVLKEYYTKGVGYSIIERVL
tara:strand:+ start:1833 stop:2387 length:555 start_codon:yes stop_codon:yes gene_type:complete